MTDRSVRVRLSADTDAFRRGMRESSRDVNKLETDLRNLDARIKAVSGSSVKVQAKLDRAAFDAELRRLNKNVKVKASLDTSSWRREARTASDAIRVKIKADLDVSKRQKRLTATIRGDFEAGTKQRLQAQLDRMALHVNVRGNAGSGFGGGSGGGGGGGISGRGAAIGGGALPLVGSLPQVLSLLSASTAEATALAGQLGLAASAGAGLAPVFGSALQGLGALVAGTSGIRAAFKAYSADQSSAAGTNPSAVRSAANTLISARESVARAQEQASRSIEAALQQQSMAERNLGDAQRAATQAQKDLSAARKQAQQDLEDLTSQAAGGLIAEREDVLALQDAQAALAKTPQGTEQFQKAQIAVDRATLSLADQRRENGRLAEQQQQAAKQGIEGSAVVVQAQDQVTQAVRAQGDAQQAVSQASTDVARTQVDNARSIADAQRSLVQAQQAYRDATNGTSASTSKLNDALAKLGPNQRAFYDQAVRSKSALDGLKNAVGERLFAGMDASLRTVTTNLLPLFQSSLGDTGNILGRVGRGLVTDLAGPLRGRLAGALSLNNDLMRQGAPIVGHLASTFLSIYVALGPLAKRIVQGANSLAGMADHAAKAGLESGRLGAFFDRAGDRAANLLHGLGNLRSALTDVFRIGNEGSAGMLPAFERLTKRFEDFTGSTEGRSDLRRWFTEGRVAASAFKDLLQTIKTEFSGITDGAGPSEIIDAFRRAVPYLADFIKRVADGGETFRRLSDILGIFGGGTLTAVQSLLGVGAAIADIVRAVPGLSTVVAGAVTALAAFRIYGLAQGPIGSVGKQFTRIGRLAQAAYLQVLTWSAAPSVMAAVRLAITQTSAAFAALSTTAKAGIIGGAVIGGVYLLGRATDHLTDAFAKARVSSAELRSALKINLEESSGIPINRDLEGLTKNLDLLTKPDRLTRLTNLETGLLHLGDTKDVKEAKNQIKDLDTALADMVKDGNGDQAVSALDALARQQGLSADQTARLKSQLTQYSTAVHDAGGETALALIPMQRLNDQSTDLKNAQNRLASATQDVIDKFTILNSGALSTERANENLQSRTDALTESVKSHGRSLQANTTNGEANRSALLDLVEAANESAQATFKHTAETEGLAAAQAQSQGVLDATRQKLYDQARQSGLTKDAARELIDQVLLTPATVQTQFNTPGLDAAKTGVQQLQDQLTQLYGANIAIDLTTRGTANPGQVKEFHGENGGVVSYFAQGGIQKPGPESHVAQIAPAGAMRVWAEPETGGESYIPLAPAKRSRSLNIWQETGKRLGAIPFADGGVVTPTSNLTFSADVQPGVDYLKSLLAGAVTGGSAAIKSFINSVDPLPYIWGGVGPGGYDCSGLAGEVWARATGNKSFKRYFTTASFQPENFGMRNGTGGVLSLGFNDHHVVGNYGGLPFEAESTKTGIKVGAAATPVASMPRRYYLPGDAGSVGAAGPGLASGSGDAGNVSTGGSPRSIGQQVASSMGYGDQFSAIDYVFSHESGWNPNAKNSTSSAYGIPQFLDATWKQYGGKTADPAVQSQDGIEYMRDRYNSPNGAAAFWAAHHWYGDGGIEPGSMLNPHVRDSGGPLLPGYTYNGTGRAERVEYVQGPGRSVDLSSVSTSGMAGRTLDVGGIHVHGSDITPADVVRELAWQVR